MVTKVTLHQKCTLILLGIFLFFTLLEIGFRLAGFIIVAAQDYRNKIAMRQSSTFRIMCIGESTTVGGGRSKSYPYFLEEILNQRHAYRMRFSVINKGKGAINTTYILTHLEENCDIYRPNMVVAMIGINDEGPLMLYQDQSASKTLRFLKSFKIYTFARLLRLHIAAKLKELGIYMQHSHIVSEEARKRAAAVNPRNKEALGMRDNEHGRPKETEETLKKAVALNPTSDKAYVALGKFYREQGKFNEAEDVLTRAIELNTRNDETYVELGWTYFSHSTSDLAENTLKKAIALNPQNENAYSVLAHMLHKAGKFSEAVEVLKKLIALNPRSAVAHTALGRNYMFLEKPAYAEEFFKKAIALNPSDYMAYFELSKFYLLQGDTAQGEAMFKKVEELNPGSSEIYGVVASLYQVKGGEKRAEEHYVQANEINKGYYNIVTRGNYLKIKEILDTRRIPLVCVQYPMRSVEPLKKIFQNQKGMVFVDNEKIFKDVVKKEGFKEYFTDLSAGDFGHCSLRGNKLLAENVASVILKERFK